MNVLIVDDNKNNRMMLKLLLEDYMEENPDVKFLIDEAEDGLVAVEKCQNNDYDIVLMDIMMPNMDGIDATKIIRSEHPKMMIIAVSAVDDLERQKLILSNGAEDYISKPVNADIFISRMTNYIKLSESRKTKKIISEIVTNVFTKEVFSRHTRFMISSDDSLSEFWEYYLLSTDAKCDDLSDVVRTVFTIGEIYIKLNINFDIFVENSENKKYFTLTNIDKIPEKIINLTMKKNAFDGKYKIENTKISFELDLVFSDLQEIAHEPEQVQDSVEKEEIIASSIEIKSSQSLQVFDYMDNEDLIDLEEYVNLLNSVMLIVGSGGVTEEDVAEIYVNLERIGGVLASYSEIYEISTALKALSIDMSEHMQDFIDNSEALGPMCAAFSRDMSSWIEKSFHTGAPSIDFMNDTIVVNCQTIGGMLKMNDAPPADANEDFDDIFDF